MTQAVIGSLDECGHVKDRVTFSDASPSLSGSPSSPAIEASHPKMKLNRPGLSSPSTFLVCDLRQICSLEGRGVVRATARTKCGVTKGVACSGSVSRGLAGLIFFSVNHIQKLDVRDRCKKTRRGHGVEKPGPGPALTGYVGKTDILISFCQLDTSKSHLRENLN